MTIRPLIIQTEALHPRAAAWLREHFDVREVAPEEVLECSELADAHGLVIRTYTRVTAPLLDRAPTLRVVGRAGVGLDQVDVRACRARGIEVVHTPDANTQAVVEYVLAIVTKVARPLHRVTDAMPGAEWCALRADVASIRQLDERTCGILGLGRIGRRVAEVALAIGMRVIFNDLRMIADPPSGAMAVPVEELFATSDVISIHVDGRSSNRGFVGQAQLQRMRPDLLFINTSRGFVVDSQALAAFLRANPAAQAHLDVHEPEPIEADSPLLQTGNAFLYPHLAAKTESAMEAMSWVVRDVAAVIEGRAAHHPAPVSE